MPKKLTEEFSRHITRQCRNDATWFQIIRDLSITARHVRRMRMGLQRTETMRARIQAAPPCGYGQDTVCNLGAQEALWEQCVRNA